MKIVQHQSKQGFRKPVVVNDWGSLGYFMKAKQSDFGTWGIHEQDPKERIGAGSKIEVLWENGHITQETVQGEPQSYRVSDMGHEYEVSTTVLFIMSDLNGHKVRIPLEDLHIKLL